MRAGALRVALQLLLLVGHAPLAAASPDCAVPAELIEDDPRLPETKARLEAKRPLTIVALGGGSTAGTAVGTTEKAWPARLEAAMRQRWPGVPVSVLNKGVPRQTTQEMIERLGIDVFAEKPALVIWETGINDAVRGDDIEEFTHKLETGIDEIREHGVELMLMDMQFSRGTASIINFDRYLEALHRAADLHDIYLFRRFDIMRYWSEHEVFNFDDVPKSERAALATRAYDCLAKRLADAIAFATQ
jgi:hypothetical protein